jgi:hypothetical protein
MCTISTESATRLPASTNETSSEEGDISDTNAADEDTENEEGRIAEEKRNLAWLAWILERKDAQPFSAQTLKKAVGWIHVDAPEIVKTLLQYNAHAIDEAMAKSAADNEYYGDKVKKVLVGSKNLVIGREQLLSYPSFRVRNRKSSSPVSSSRVSCPSYCPVV